jgi:hypothetical protein
LLLVLALASLAATPRPTPTARPTPTPTPTNGPREVPKGDRLLLRLESGSGTPVLKEDVYERAGLHAVKKPEARSTWKFLPGESVKATQAPTPRVVDLYTGTSLSPILLCRILIRFFPNGDTWEPRFMVVDEPALVFVNGRWQPAQVGQGNAVLLVQHGSTLPNPEGFFPVLELGLTTGGFDVVGWQVRSVGLTP